MVHLLIPHPKNNSSYSRSLLVAAILLCFSFVSSHADSDPQNEFHPAAAQNISSTAAISSTQAKLAFNLITALAHAAKSPNSNIIISPGSLTAVFSLLDQGSDTAMRKAIATVLGVETDTKETAVTFDDLRAAEHTFRDAVPDAAKSANELILDPSIAPYPIVRDALIRAGTEIESEDLRKPEVVANINAWVKDKTAGLIPDILDGPLDKPALVALNALYFKAKWQHPFEPAATQEASFKTSNGGEVSTKMMHLPPNKYAFRSDAHFLGADLAFEGGRFQLTIVTAVDKLGTVADFKQAGSWLSGAEFELHEGDIAMPRLNLHGSGDLLPALDALGLRKGRSSPTALGGFAPGIQLSQVVQKVVFNADEEGAEAAAATAATVSRSFEGKPLHLVLDRPFLFALRDDQTGLILLAGYVGNPSQ
jgi:serpin B